MSRIRRYSISAFCFNPTKSGSDGTPAPNAARASTRVQQRPPGSLTVKTADVTDQKADQEDEPNTHVLWLLRMKRLPPLSPEGSQFETDIRQGKFTHADVVGESLSQYLQDGMPGLEEVLGEEEADSKRRKIEVCRRGDYKELHDMLLPGGIFYPPDQWGVGERDTSRYPMAICTTGAVTMEQLLSAARSVANDSRTASKTTTPSSAALRIGEQLLYSSDSGDESSVYLTTSDMDDDSLQYSDYDSDEEQDGSSSKEKSLLELFPHQRFRDDI